MLPAFDISSLLSRFPGVIVSREDGLLSVSTVSHGNPSFIVDGMFVDNNYVKDMNANDIAQIDFLKSTNATIFGMRGGGGVFVIFTKDGKTGYKPASPDSLLHVKTIMPLGLQHPVEYHRTQQAITYNPERRNPILWIPALNTNDEGEISFKFNIFDTKKEYTIIIEGISANGKIIDYNGKIRVNPLNYEICIYTQ
jgi:hypothetical protein